MRVRDEGGGGGGSRVPQRARARGCRGRWGWGAGEEEGAAPRARRGPRRQRGRGHGRGSVPPHLARTAGRRAGWREARGSPMSGIGGRYGRGRYGHGRYGRERGLLCSSPRCSRCCCGPQRRRRLQAPRTRAGMCSTCRLAGTRAARRSYSTAWLEQCSANAMQTRRRCHRRRRHRRRRLRPHRRPRTARPRRAPKAASPPCCIA